MPPLVNKRLGQDSADMFPEFKKYVDLTNLVFCPFFFINYIHLKTRFLFFDQRQKEHCKTKLEFPEI